MCVCVCIFGENESVREDPLSRIPLYIEGESYERRLPFYFPYLSTHFLSYANVQTTKKYRDNTSANGTTVNCYIFSTKPKRPKRAMSETFQFT